MITAINNKTSMLFLVISFTLTALVSSNGFASEEEFYSSGHESDRIESVNRFVFKFNDKADQYIVKPVAKVYRYVTPVFVDRGITNIFQNLDDVETFVNSLFQFKFHNAIVTLNRIIYNTTFGLGGFFDVATTFGLYNHEEDFGQTLGYWGYQESTYLVLPFLGPSTVRDFSGRFVDAAFDPLVYSDDIHRDKRLLAKGLKLIDLRADLLAAENLQLSDDRYAFFRNAYLQNRDYLIKDGVIEDSFTNDGIDYDSF
ncbi:MAG: phospholipid-binding lipoprotein MlaA [Oleiphilaceae bacterium]|jgi:phospholipid-binding lipoprotein MlaA